MAVTDEQTELVQQYLDQFVGNSKIPPIEIVLLGFVGVGKRSICNRIAYKAWLEHIDPTDPPWLGSTHLIHGRTVMARWHSFHLDKGQGDSQLLLQHNALRAFLEDSSYEGCMLVYDVTSAKTMRGLEATCDSWRRSEVQRTPAPTAFFVVASRIDCEKAKWEVSPHEGRQLSQRLGAPFLQVSARADTGLDEETTLNIINRILQERAIHENAMKDLKQEKDESKFGSMLRRLKRRFRVQ